MALFPTEAVARAWENLTAIRTFVGMDAPALEAVEAETGGLQDSIRNLALLPSQVVRAAASAAKIPTGEGEEMELRNLSPIQAAQVGLIWRIARRLMSPDTAAWNSYIDEDPMVEPVRTPPTSPVDASAAASGSGLLALAPLLPSQGAPMQRKLKMSSYVDQSDDSEFFAATRPVELKWYQNYVSFAMGPPLDEEEPTAEQLQALNTRVYSNEVAPYVDLAIWGPFNRKVVRAMKFMAWLPQADGGFIRKEIPGPANFSSWEVGWKVFRVACIMLSIVCETALAIYFANFKRLCGLWPEAWHLLYLAEDKVRAEGLEKYRRRIENSISNGHPPPMLWDAANPWSSCLIAAAQDRDYWQENVKDLATAWIARGASGAPLTLDEMYANKGLREIGGAGALSAPTETPQQGRGVRRPAGEGQSKNAKKRRREMSYSNPVIAPAKGNSKGKGKSQSGKGKKQKLLQADTDGSELCYSWNNRKGSCAGDGNCPNSRMHKCQICLGNHRLVDHK